MYSGISISSNLQLPGNTNTTESHFINNDTTSGKDNSPLANAHKVIMKLIESADDLNEDNKEAATEKIKSITEQINSFKSIAQGEEQKSKAEQQRLTRRLEELITEQGKIEDEIRNIQKEIDNKSKNIEVHSVQIEELKKQINSLNSEIHKLRKKIERHKKELDNIWKWSVIPVAALILQIKSLIQDDASKMKSARREMENISNTKRSHESELKNAADLHMKLSRQKDDMCRHMEQLNSEKNSTHEKEKKVRRKVAFMTEIALFYGKVDIMLNQIDHRITDVKDIVEELNDETPRIIDFDSSCDEHISLKKALLKFAEYIA